MLLTGYSLEIFKSKCNPQARGVHCFAHLHDDVGPVLPFLNTLFGAHTYSQDPPNLMLQHYGKLIAIESRKISINALADREEAEKICAWLQREINEAWERRFDIEPSTKSNEKPVLFEILKLLPRNNCRACGLPTCTVFASRVVEGSMDQSNCPELTDHSAALLKTYLGRFSF